MSRSILKDVAVLLMVLIACRVSYSNGYDNGFAAGYRDLVARISDGLKDKAKEGEPEASEVDPAARDPE